MAPQVSKTRLAGWLGMILWTCWIVGRTSWTVQNVAGCIWLTAASFLALNTILHLVYGRTVFLYLAHFLGPLVVVILVPLLSHGGVRARVLVVALVALALFGNVTTYLTALEIVESLFRSMYAAS